MAKRKTNLIIAIVLATAAGVLTLQNVFAPAPSARITEAPETEQCAYLWANYAAPELTEKVNHAVQTANPAASARAELFGEDCRYADGRSTFGVMETDFYIYLPATDLTDEEFFGDWIAQAMHIITEIPRAEIKGKYGFVEFWFEKNNSERVIVRVPLQDYLDKAQKKSGAELFGMFYKTP